MDYGSVTAFAFTEARIEAAARTVQRGEVRLDHTGRRWWRDEGDSHGLHLLVSKAAAVYYRVHKHAGKRHRVRIGDATAMPLTKARQVTLKLAGGQRDAAPPPMRVRTDGVTVGEAWKAYIADVTSGEFVAGRNRTSPATIKSYEELYRPHVKPYASKSLHALAKLVPEFHRKLRDKPATANRLLQVLRNLFVHATRKGTWAQPNPAIDQVTGRGLKKYTVASRARHLTTAEASRVLAFAATEPQPWRDFWRLLILTGVRASALREMKWAHLDLRKAESTWAIPTTKNGDPQLVPLTETATVILRQRLDDAPKHEPKGKQQGNPASVWVFPMREDPGACIADLDHAWARVKEHAPLEGVRIHDLRRTAGSWATQGGAPLPAVGKLLGHRSHNSTAVYAWADIGAARAAAEIVAARLSEAEGNK